MLLFDVSGSMAADDVTPSRMEAAKAAARSIVDARPEGVVIGVVAFSDAGLAVQEPTSDQAAVLAAVERMVPSRGTSLGAGILATLAALDKARATTPPDYYSNRSPEPSATPAPVPPGSDASTVIVVLSDGENTERPDPQEAAAAAANRGIRVITLGVGTAEGTTLDLDGFRVQTRLDEGALQAIADRTDGTYLPRGGRDEAGPASTTSWRARWSSRDEDVELTALVAGARARPAAGRGRRSRWSARDACHDVPVGGAARGDPRGAGAHRPVRVEPPPARPRRRALLQPVPAPRRRAARPPLAAGTCRSRCSPRRSRRSPSPSPGRSSCCPCRPTRPSWSSRWTCPGACARPTSTPTRLEAARTRR